MATDLAVGRSALIGHTGFVGSNLARQHGFDAFYNSTNIESAAGEEFDLVACAGVRAEKWIANADPEADRAAIARLLSVLERVSARRFLLISTVDVFARPVGVDESSPVVVEGLHAYGTNRRWLEEQVAERFAATVLRLPGLYGRGIKKNVIHDFLRRHETWKIDSRGIFQFYSLERLWRDSMAALDASLPLVHLVTEPVSVRDVAAEAFGLTFENHVVDRPARYDLRTIHAERFGGVGSYIEGRSQVLAGIREFVKQDRAG